MRRISPDSDSFEISGAELDMALRRAAKGESRQAILLDLCPEYFTDTLEVGAMLRELGIIGKTETSSEDEAID
jgi:hypothetical protein